LTPPKSFRMATSTHLPGARIDGCTLAIGRVDGKAAPYASTLRSRLQWTVFEPLGSPKNGKTFAKGVPRQATPSPFPSAGGIVGGAVNPRAKKGVPSFAVLMKPASVT